MQLTLRVSHRQPENDDMSKATSRTRNARRTKPKRAAGCAPPAGYLALGSELGELVLLECIVRDHGIALEELSKRLKRTSELLGQMRDNIRKREAR